MSDNTNQVPEDVQEFATKLFTMARTGDASLLDYVDHGVDVNLTNQDGNSLVMLAAYTGNAALVEGLIGRDADVDKQNARGQTPLAGAIFKQEDTIVQLLLRAGANPHAGHPNAIETARMFGYDLELPENKLD